MLLTIFACPKSMDDAHIAMIQRNAIRSWLMLDPKPQVILIGDSFGIGELAAELSVLWIADVECSEYGTPLVRSVFEAAENRASGSVLVYVNSDIVLMQEFVRGLRVTERSFRRYLFGVRPWNLDVLEPLDFRMGWEKILRRRCTVDGKIRGHMACDVFAYPKGMWRQLPPLVIGRVGFDNVLLKIARQQGAALIDGSHGVLSIHQNHPYPSHLQDQGYYENPEGRRNVALGGGPQLMFGWANSTHVYDGTRVSRSWRNFHRSIPSIYPFVVRCRHRVWYPLLRITRPLRLALGLSRRPG